MIIRSATIGSTKIELSARDQYSDYSVVYDHSIQVQYGNGRCAQFEVGTNKSAAIGKFNDAVALAHRHTAQAAA